ncbi:unnamed protein product [Adineta ricciae]|uniref:Uncharacterized protein n=1 Tax=Adineta ricciae TaxID=249248 RepID=A0A815CZY3_ADIRI|nr:unnamed protein product [Adineta ricciae]
MKSVDVCFTTKVSSKFACELLLENFFLVVHHRDEQLDTIIINLIKSCGFKDSNPDCICVLRTCLFDVYQDLLMRLKQHMESLGSSVTFQDAFERTLDEVNHFYHVYAINDTVTLILSFEHSEVNNDNTKTRVKSK